MKKPKRYFTHAGDTVKHLQNGNVIIIDQGAQLRFWNGHFMGLAESMPPSFIEVAEAMALRLLPSSITNPGR